MVIGNQLNCLQEKLLTGMKKELAISPSVTTKSISKCSDRLCYFKAKKVIPKLDGVTEIKVLKKRERL